MSTSFLAYSVILFVINLDDYEWSVWFLACLKTSFQLQTRS